jgi:hypothetical protein
MREAMKTADNEANMKNTNPETPDKSTCFRENSFPALEWE